MIRAIVTDIEGTTSAIDFVHNVLFPYATRALPDFVRAHCQRPEVDRALTETAEASGIAREDIEGLIAQLLQWIAADKKITPLKRLQGHIWEQGYRNGDYQAHLYPDAAAQLQRWHDQGLALYVYSSGSVYAQKLFFEFSEAGNLLGLFSGHFDTTTGAKQAVGSYQIIQQQLGLPAGEIVFLSDVAAELDAARAAGLATVHVVREADGTQPCPDHRHPQVTSFHDIRLD